MSQAVLSQTRVKDTIGVGSGHSDGTNLELFGERRARIVGIPRLSLAHHVDHLDAGQDDSGALRRLEAEHRSDAALDPPVVLLDPVVEVLAPAETSPG
jgi:hypothetical protein